MGEEGLGMRQTGDQSELHYSGTSSRIPLSNIWEAEKEKKEKRKHVSYLLHYLQMWRGCPLSEVIFHRVCTRVVLCWEVYPLSECPLSEYSL